VPTIAPGEPVSVGVADPPAPRGGGIASGPAYLVAAGVVALVAPVAGAIAVSVLLVLVLLFGRRRDAVTIVGGMFVLFVAVPTRYSFAGFGPLTPGMLLATLALLGWLWGRVVSEDSLDGGRQPVRGIVVVLLIGSAVGFATMFTHPVTDEQFVNAHRSPGVLLMFAGVTLLIADGVRDRRRLDDLLEIIVLCGGALAICGLIEQATGHRLFTGARLPLLTENPSQLTITERNGFLRIGGTAKHPIEFAVVMATTIPLGIHLALHGRPGVRRTAGILTLLMGVALPLAISRSGIVGLAVGVLVLGVGWSWRRRFSAVVAVLATVAVLFVATPRLVNTMSDLFLDANEDTSIEARTRDYKVLDEVLAESPVFGRGLGEYNVTDYEVFDNQYLATIVDGGYVGLGIQVFAFLAPLIVAWQVVHSARDEATRHCARAVAASLCVLAVSWAFFDGAGYRIATGLVFALTGVVGALWRIEHRDRDAQLEPVLAWGRPPDARSDTEPPVDGGDRWGPPELARPMSVVVPAHDEELVIGRCLSTLLRGAEPGELDVVVVCNGCSDRTAEIAQRFPVRVIEIDKASKHAALNLGDAAVRRFPRFYVDADVQVSVGALRATADAMAAPGVHAAAPRLRLDLRGCGRAVRAYYRVWRRLPYCSDGMVGSGVYGVTAAGHARLGRFPDVIADDLWFRNHFDAGERRSVAGASFVQRPPRDMRSLLRVRTRQCLGNIEYRRRFPGPAAEQQGRRTRYVARLLSPSAMAGAPVYLGVNVVARRAARQRWRDGALQWDRDVSARVRAAT